MLPHFRILISKEPSLLAVSEALQQHLGMLQSLFYINNETFNMWSHIVVCFYFIVQYSVVLSIELGSSSSPKQHLFTQCYHRLSGASQSACWVLQLIHLTHGQRSCTEFSTSLTMPILESTPTPSVKSGCSSTIDPPEPDGEFSKLHCFTRSSAPVCLSWQLSYAARVKHGSAIRIIPVFAGW